MRISNFIVLLLIFFIHTTIIRVSEDIGKDTNTCGLPKTPCHSLSQGIHRAEDNGTVLVISNLINYYPIIITKSILITSNERSKIIMYNGFYVYSENITVVFHNLHLSGSNSLKNFIFSDINSKKSRIIVDDCFFGNSIMPVEIASPQSFILIQNSIFKHSAHGIYQSGDANTTFNIRNTSFFTENNLSLKMFPKTAIEIYTPNFFYEEINFQNRNIKEKNISCSSSYSIYDFGGILTI
jgi:hypothetical protein